MRTVARYSILMTITRRRLRRRLMEDVGPAKDGNGPPEVRLGNALRAAREARDLSLRALARRLNRAHSNLVEYERGHRLAPKEVVQAYERELGLEPRSLLRMYEDAHAAIHGDESRSRRSPRPLPAFGSKHIRPLHVVPVAVAVALAAAVFAAVRPPPSRSVPVCEGQTTRGVAFVGETYEKGVAIREGADRDFPMLGRLAGGCRVGFVGYCLGETVNDVFVDEPDMRWFVLPGNSGVIASAVIKGNPKDSRPTPCPGSRPAPQGVALTTASGPTASLVRISADASGAPIVGFAAAQLDAGGGAPVRWTQIGWDSQPNDGFNLDWDTGAFLAERQVDRGEVLVAAVVCVAKAVPSGGRALLSLTIARESPPALANGAPPLPDDLGAGADRAACSR